MPGADKSEKRLSDIHRNPFHLLGATTRDNRLRIVELADLRGLDLDPEVCQKARSELTNPRARLKAEVGWLPGVSPRKTTQLIEALETDALSVRTETNLPTLAQLNLLCASIELQRDMNSAVQVAGLIEQVVQLADEVDPQQVFRDINEDRSVSGIAQVTSLDALEADLADRYRYFRNVLKSALDQLPPDLLVGAVTWVVEKLTVEGTRHPPRLLDDIVDTYSLEARDFLEREAENLQKLVASAQKAAPAGAHKVKPIVDQIVLVAKNWDKVAQPIQLIAMAKGTDHAESADVAYSIRNLSIELFNDHDLLVESKRLTALLKEIFAELPEVLERAETDAEALTSITQQRQDSAEIKPIINMCTNAQKSIASNPADAHNTGQRLFTEAIAALKSSGVQAASSAHAQARDIIALTMMQSAVAYGNATSKWEPCMGLLEKAVQIVSDPDIRARISENLRIVRSNYESVRDLKPIDSAPFLGTVNGIGFTLYGASDLRISDMSHVSTYYFVFLAIPLFPIARYRVISSGDGYRFLGKAKFRPLDFAHIALFVGLLLWLFSSGSG
jgi:hypothetical protein